MSERRTDDAGADPRRAVPSVDQLLRSPAAVRASQRLGRPLVRASLRRVLEEVRRRADGGAPLPDERQILARAVGAAARDFYGMRDVINATGVLLHTGLGRAPLPAIAARTAAAMARGYTDLEVDRDTGDRGRRTAHAEAMLEALTGAEAAAVVNNNAAAVLLCLACFAPRKDVLVSRGELIEIGGEFRLPDIMAASGAKLVEVGTTNRTRADDYRQALSRRTGLILKVHPSNYRVVGFTRTVPLPELAALAGTAGVPLLYDIGSGLLEPVPELPDDEPAVSKALADGADLVSFSGDKLLGGPQAGIVVGRREPVERIKRHPLARALRLDKMSVAALEAVLRLYLAGRVDDIPFWRLLRMPEPKLRDRAAGLAGCFGDASVTTDPATIGGGSVPGHTVPSAQLVIPVPTPARVAARLRAGRPPVFSRVDSDALVFDLRTVPPEDDDRLLRAIRYALEQE